ncbi:hypothetical protein [Leptolyngbya sp. PCC 6406]|uniref:hypothetical protein n=1 Tax=Leptolyngbya sp. PCC 6406 TaxID=1173264 RepID=UPI0002ACBDED|nr:hypothetical protein [Leptolyngbya sp. PCC 6406]
MLKFADAIARRQADMLMQPALIRVIDNIRKHLEDSTWQGTYQETQMWPPDTSEAEMRQVKALQAQVVTASPEEIPALQAALEPLPTPFPGYELHLEKDDQQRIVDVWELCCCVCFQHFPTGDAPVAVDTTLWDADIDDVDWLRLDTKAKELVDEVFTTIEAHHA